MGSMRGALSMRVCGDESSDCADLETSIDRRGATLSGDFDLVSDGVHVLTMSVATDDRFVQKVDSPIGVGELTSKLSCEIQEETSFALASHLENVRESGLSGLRVELTVEDKSASDKRVSALELDLSSRSSGGSRLLREQAMVHDTSMASVSGVGPDFPMIMQAQPPTPALDAEDASGTGARRGVRGSK